MLKCDAVQEVMAKIDRLENVAHGHWADYSKYSAALEELIAAKPIGGCYAQKHLQVCDTPEEINLLENKNAAYRLFQVWAGKAATAREVAQMLGVDC